MLIKVLKGIEIMSDGFDEDLFIFKLRYWWKKWNQHPKVLLYENNTRILLKEDNLYHILKLLYRLFVVID